MPFLAPFLPAIIGAGGAAAGGILAGRRSPQEKAATQAQTELLRLEQEAARRRGALAEEVLPFGARYLARGEEAFQPVLDYWGRILRGDRGEITSLLSPELSRISEGYRTARTTLGELSPRTGATAATMAELPFQQQRDVSSLFMGMRPAAAKSLLDLAGEGGRMGAGIYQIASGLLRGTGEGGLGLLQSELARRAQQYGIGRDIGRSLLDLLSQLNLGKGGGSDISGLLGAAGGPFTGQLPGRSAVPSSFWTNYAWGK